MTRRTGSLASLLLVATSLAACTADDGPPPGDVAAAAARALSQDRPGEVPWAAPAARPRAWWAGLVGDLEDASASAEVGEVTEADDGRRATAELTWTWRIPETDTRWRQRGTLVLVRDEQGWRVRQEPSLLGLRRGESLAVRTEPAPRAPILGAGGTAIVEDRPVLRFGIDKTQVPARRQADAARRLAAVVQVDAGALVERVRAAGEKAFVEAIVLRRQEAGAARRAVAAIDGAVALPDTLPLAPTREFARPILGTVGPVTAEIVEASEGAYQAGDEAGLSGLQQRYDEQLRGTPGLTVAAVADDRERELFHVEPRSGRPLRTTLSVPLQTAAERILADVGPPSALVAIRPSTGGVLAAASGPGSAGYSTATVGQYAPGSTFKIVSTLAFLRSGLGAGAGVDCPASVVVDGKRFENYDDYPPARLGRITLREAVAHSCNTAFVAGHDRADGLADAAAALGLGVDHDLGFPAYFGSVPAPGSETGAAAALIGQGEVLASPLAMAAVMASVVRGEAVLPRLLADHDVAQQDPASPLTAAEAASLREMLAAVVAEGSGSGLADVPGPPVLAKTGTAEFGTDRPLRTHAWLVAGQGDLAVAGFVEVGESGSATAGPLVEALLRAAG